MSERDPWSKSKPPAKVSKTFWITPDSFIKLKKAQALAEDPDEIVRVISDEIEKKIAELYEQRPIEKELG